ncbi:hypothetical protein [Streptomyces aidingensis]|uniref:Uncharacterized protein n=1 Tax=Streptomyces aidingensis TaxID=910347 RepID=A0A1I1TZB3_9ACTN|nr:hypothetical protein [Streptomyces aidingensis]SFD61743.1 hypothetical protein SAMN05421773_12119 [Streptomyces aidingensis]
MNAAQLSGILGAQRSRRHDAALRCPPLECACGADHRDSLLCLAAPFGRSTYGLSSAALAAEAARCRAAGWQQWEISARFDLQAADAA